MREGKKWLRKIPYRDRVELATEIKDAFEEGYESYETQCCAYNSVETAWEESLAKYSYDSLLE